MNPVDRWRVILAAEGNSDHRRIEQLLEHLLPQGTAAPSPMVRIEGLNGEPYIMIKNIPILARERNLGLRYSPAGSKKGDGGTLRALYQVLQKEKLLGPKTVVIWARDDDGHGETRRADVSGARESLPDTTPIILAIASECGEAWVIAGWRPETPADEEKLRKLRQSLGFEPHVYPERLSHKDNAPRSAKAVIVELFAGDREKEASALGVAANSSHRASEACGLPQS